MKPPETNPTYRACLRAIRILSWLVPADRRSAWQDEWRGELDHFWRRLAGRADRSAARTSLLRRTRAAGTDAAWLRRQVTRDADLIHDVRHAARLFRRRPGVALGATLVVALATGAATALFSVASAAQASRRQGIAVGGGTPLVHEIARVTHCVLPRLRRRSNCVPLKPPLRIPRNPARHSSCCSPSHGPPPIRRC